MVAGLGGSGLDETLGEAVGQRSEGSVRTRLAVPGKCHGLNVGKDPGAEPGLALWRSQPYLCSWGAESLVPTVAGSPWGELWKGWLFSCDFSEEEKHST